MEKEKKKKLILQSIKIRKSTDINKTIQKLQNDSKRKSSNTI